MKKFFLFREAYNAETKPAGALGKKWGTTFKNHRGDLPGVVGDGG
jgi:hypothetical protein